mmetsp:Transcript_37700/g.112651  ORF Transcript_37700/g.112651 Transcript_37700/m.112651 type:complete len:396 (-) Transcript_37700:219-1406(-)
MGGFGALCRRRRSLARRRPHRRGCGGQRSRRRGGRFRRSACRCGWRAAACDRGRRAGGRARRCCGRWRRRRGLGRARGDGGGPGVGGGRLSGDVPAAAARAQVRAQLGGLRGRGPRGGRRRLRRVGVCVGVDGGVRRVRRVRAARDDQKGAGGGGGGRGRRRRGGAVGVRPGRRRLGSRASRGGELAVYRGEGGVGADGRGDARRSSSSRRTAAARRGGGGGGGGAFARRAAERGRAERGRGRAVRLAAGVLARRVSRGGRGAARALPRVGVAAGLRVRHARAPLQHDLADLRQPARPAPPQLRRLRLARPLGLRRPEHEGPGAPQGARRARGDRPGGDCGVDDGVRRGDRSEAGVGARLRRVGRELHRGAHREGAAGVGGGARGRVCDRDGIRL